MTWCNIYAAEWQSCPATGCAVDRHHSLGDLENSHKGLKWNLKGRRLPLCSQCHLCGFPGSGKIDTLQKQFVRIFPWQKKWHGVTQTPDCISLGRDESNVRVTGSIWEPIFLLQAPNTEQTGHVAAYFHCNVAPPPTTLSYRGVQIEIVQIFRHTSNTFCSRIY